jgi:hypothetical protein
MPPDVQGYDIDWGTHRWLSNGHDGEVAGVP